MEEIWKDIEGYEGLYQISNLGRIKRLARTLTHKNRWGGIQSQPLPERILTISYSKDAYGSVALTRDGVTCSKLVHRIVATAFIPNPDNLPQVNHKDENPSNNRVDNLEWCTAKYNNNYGTKRSKISAALTGKPKSEEYKKSMSEARSGKGNPMYGKRHTQEFKEARREQMRQMRTGNHPWNYGKKMPCAPWNKGKRFRSILCLDTKETFDGLDKAANWLSVTEEAIHYAATHIACCRGHVFAYLDNLPEDIDAHIDKCYAKSRRSKKQ